MRHPMRWKACATAVPIVPNPTTPTSRPSNPGRLSASMRPRKSTYRPWPISVDAQAKRRSSIDAAVTAYSATALLLAPGTLATGILSRAIAASSSRSTPAPVIWTRRRLQPSNKAAASFGPTAGMTSAAAAVIRCDNVGSSGLPQVTCRDAGGSASTRAKSASGRRQRTSNAITISKSREFVGPRADVRNREETQKDERNTPGVARHVLLAWRDEDDVARLDRELAALGMRR